MTCDEILSRLESLGDAKWKAAAIKRGSSPNQFGVKMGDIRAVAKEAKTDHDRAMELWQTGNLEARLVATLTMKPKSLSGDTLESMLQDVTCGQLADWTMSYVVKQHPRKEDLRLRWMNSPHPMLGRAAWSLTSEKIVDDPGSLDLSALLDRIERELADAPELAQWTMNGTLATIGIHDPDLRDRALSIGERLGVYRDYPTSKGCTSPFAPIWINEMVRRQG